MRKFIFGISLLVLIAVSGRADHIERDLGFGLTYLRASSFLTDLPGEKQRGSTVLDLRYADGDNADAGLVRSWLKQHATTRVPIFILINEDTSAELLRKITSPPALSGVLTLGPAVDGFTPDIVINTFPEQERQIYVSLDSVVDIKTLIATSPKKIRRDEATMLAAKTRGETMVDEPEIELTDQTDPTAEFTPMIDWTLQRAMQIHRSWIFLLQRKR